MKNLFRFLLLAGVLVFCVTAAGNVLNSVIGSVNSRAAAQTAQLNEVK